MLECGALIPAYNKTCGHKMKLKSSKSNLGGSTVGIFGDRTMKSQCGNV